MSRERDVSFETLAQVCAVDLGQVTSSSRGALNRALAEIRRAMPDVEDLELAMLIESKAKTYRRVMEGALLTPTALAKHWASLDGMLEAQSAPVTYVSNDRAWCSTCGGDRMVLAAYRPVNQKVKAEPDHGYEEYRPCPDCNQVGQAIVQDYRDRFERIHATPVKPPAPGVLSALKGVVDGKDV